jgi:hypothetical protein
MADAWPNAFPRVSTHALAQAVNVVEALRTQAGRRALTLIGPVEKANAPKERLLDSDPRLAQPSD